MATYYLLMTNDEESEGAHGGFGLTKLEAETYDEAFKEAKRIIFGDPEKWHVYTVVGSNRTELSTEGSGYMLTDVFGWREKSDYAPTEAYIVTLDHVLPVEAWAEEQRALMSLKVRIHAQDVQEARDRAEYARLKAKFEEKG